jgi:hypothetical protein
MISAQTPLAFVARENPVPTFPDHALGLRFAISGAFGDFVRAAVHVIGVSFQCRINVVSMSY